MKSRKSPSTPSHKGRRSVCAALLACSLIVTSGCRRGVDVVAGDASTEPSPNGMPSQGREVTTADMHGETADTTTVMIVLPHDEPPFPDGPGQRQFLTSCVVCHTPRYISMQPPFPQHVWASEVHKMVESYGAHVTPEEEAEIVTYIMTIRGAGTAGQSNHPVPGGGKRP
jgi:hypothetical protein